MVRLRQFYLTGVAAGCLTAPVWALEPADIVVLYNAKSADSLTVARHYVKARSIPEDHLVPVTCPVDENITEQEYRTSLLPKLKRELAIRGLDKPDAIRCLVTTYDVPLRIQAHQPTAVERADAAALEKRYDDTLGELKAQIGAFDRVAAPPAGNSNGPPATSGADASAISPATSTTRAPATAGAAEKPALLPLIQQLNVASNAAGERVGRLPPEQRVQAMNQFVAVRQRVGGISGLLISLQVAPDAPGAPSAQLRLNELSGQLRELQQQYSVLAKNRASARSREEMITLRSKAEGLIGQARAIDEMLAYVNPPETESCLDNELMLLFADADYPRARWLMNPRNIETYSSMQRTASGGGQKAESGPPVVMVTRLDGSSVQKTEQMIDTTLDVEAKGLEGKIYLDARGRQGDDAYAQFDADLRHAADWLHQHASMDVVLDDREELLSAANAPDCALYCGWYSLRNYRDSAQWVRGAVGYHVASNEMFTLHTPGEKGWVVNLLDRGFCGTLGPTDEPYLHAFPKPSLFFPLLLSGEFTQGEVWELTSPCVSWRIGYVGDPLYNPFRVHPRVKARDLSEHVILRNAFAVLGRAAPN